MKQLKSVKESKDKRDKSSAKDTSDRLKLKVSLYYSKAKYRQKQRVTMTKLAKPKLEET